jgi:hypothetical protein
LIFNKRVNLKADIQVYKIEQHMLEKRVVNEENFGILTAG